MWELIPKVAGLAIPLVGAIYRFRGSLKLRPRATLKADCEMLTILKQAEVKYSLVEARIDAEVERLYGHGEQRESMWQRVWKDATKVGRVSIGAFVLGSGIAATAYLVWDGFTWWSLLTGYVALAGIALLRRSGDARHGLSRARNELGEKVFELYRDTPLDPEVDRLVERIKTLQQHAAAGEPSAPPQQAVVDPG